MTLHPEPGRRASITLQGDTVLIHVPLSDQGLARRAPKRWIVVTCEAIRMHLGVDESRMRPSTYTGYVRNHMDRILRLADEKLVLSRAEGGGGTYVRLEKGDL